MFDKSVIAEMAFRQSVDHRLSCLPISYRRPTDFAAFTSLRMNHWLAAVASHNYRQGVDHRLSCLPALYQPMNFVTLTSEAELVASVNHRLAAVASKSSEDHYRRLAVVQEEQELLIKHDGKCNQHDTDVEKSLHLLGDVALATNKQVAFSLLELKTMNGGARSRMNTNHVSLHYPSPKFSGSALLRWAQATDLLEREASITSTGKSIVVLEGLSKDNVAWAPAAQAFKRSISSISRTKSNAKKTNAITKLPLKKRAMRRARALRRNTIALSKKKTISNCISIKTVQA